MPFVGSVGVVFENVMRDLQVTAMDRGRLTVSRGACQLAMPASVMSDVSVQDVVGYTEKRRRFALCAQSSSLSACPWLGSLSSPTSLPSAALSLSAAFAPLTIAVPAVAHRCDLRVVAV